MTYRTPITEADLHAYVDGQLSPARQREVEDYLAGDADAASRLADYRRINEDLHALYDPVLEEPVPEQLAGRRRRRRLLRTAAVAAWMALGGVIGWLLHPASEVILVAEGPMERDLVHPAAFAHTVYAAEVRHPVEVPAAQEAHLTAWLSKRLHTEIRAPNLAAQGFALMGGRLLPSTDRMAAQFMYERSDGRRVSLYIRRGAWDRELTSFRYARKDGIGVFYWIDRNMGHALVGELSRAELLTLSQTIYEQTR